MTNFSKSFQAFWADEHGATAIEYGLLASLIAVVIATSVGALGTTLDGIFLDIAEKLTPAQ